MKKLFIIPARGGSKGLPRKNIMSLAGRPMIYYTLDAAKEAAEQGDEICVSTDDREIKYIVEQYGITVPFIRPAKLASDTAGSQEVGHPFHTGNRLTGQSTTGRRRQISRQS